MKLRNYLNYVCRLYILLLYGKKAEFSKITYASITSTIYIKQNCEYVLKIQECAVETVVPAQWAAVSSSRSR